MTLATFKGEPIEILGNLPKIGDMAPLFTLTDSALNEFTLQSIRGKKVILNIFVSLDTPTCASSVRTFNSKAAELKDTAIICISQDLPFAHSRFCATENIKNVLLGSAFRHPEVAKDYGLLLNTLPLRGLMARAIIIIDKLGKIAYTELVNEITQQPNYEQAFKALENL